MMRNMLVSAAAAALLLGTGCAHGGKQAEGTARAEPEQPQQQPSQQPGMPGAGMAQSSSGTVQAASPAEIVLLEDDGTVLRLTVDPQTQVVVAGVPASAEDIQPGSDVRASYDTSGAEPLALLIEVQPDTGSVQPDTDDLQPDTDDGETAQPQ
jgi:colicin import membrane protein